MNKKLIYLLILVLSIILLFLVAVVILTSKKVEAPGREVKKEFHGPVGEPYVKGPSGPPPIGN